MQYPDGTPGTWKGKTELYEQDGKGWKKHFVQRVPLLCHDTGLQTGCILLGQG